MSFESLLIHALRISHPDPATSPDATGQLFVDATGQPLGDADINTTTDSVDWDAAATTSGRVVEQSARWPDGPGAGAELVDTKILLPRGTSVHELDKLRWDDTGQAYQAVFVHEATGLGGQHHVRVQARRIPL